MIGRDDQANESMLKLDAKLASARSFLRETAISVVIVSR